MEGWSEVEQEREKEGPKEGWWEEATGRADMPPHNLTNTYYSTF